MERSCARCHGSGAEFDRDDGIRTCERCGGGGREPTDAPEPRDG